MSTWNTQESRNKWDEVIPDVSVIIKRRKKGQGSEEREGYTHHYTGVYKVDLGLRERKTSQIMDRYGKWRHKHQKYERGKKIVPLTTAYIKVWGRLGRETTINKGIRQGCCIAPTVFKVYFLEALITYRKKCFSMGVPIGDKRLFTLHFAEYVLQKLNEEYTKCGPPINNSKTDYLVVRSKANRHHKGILETGEIQTVTFLVMKCTCIYWKEQRWDKYESRPSESSNQTTKQPTVER